MIGWVICGFGPIGDQSFVNCSDNCHCVIVVGKDVMIVTVTFEVVTRSRLIAMIPSVTMVTGVFM